MEYKVIVSTKAQDLGGREGLRGEGHGKATAPGV